MTIDITTAKSTAIVLHIEEPEEQKSETVWATITRLPFGGMIHIWSSSGMSLSGAWPYTDRSFEKAMVRASYDEIMLRTHPTMGYEFSGHKTMLALRKELLKAMRECRVKSWAKKSIWTDYLELVDIARIEMIDTPRVLLDRIEQNSPNLSGLIESGEVQFRHVEIKVPQCEIFWDRVWPELKKHWIKEIDRQAI